MKGEIKEILDNKLYFDLEEEDYIKIKDYITNLQEENENKNNKILELQQELLNKKLNVKDIEYKEKMIYKSRNEKAIEYIKEDMYGEPNKLYGLVDGEHLLNILNGGDEELLEEVE